jgi:hypothetical protein
MAKHFTQSQLEAIAGAMGDTDDGLTGSEIAHLLASCKMKDPDPALAKRHRLYNALALSQNERQDRLAVLAFIRKTMKPERFGASRKDLSRCGQISTLRWHSPVFASPKPEKSKAPIRPRRCPRPSAGRKSFAPI